MKDIKEGNLTGFTKMGCRIFFPDGSADFEHNKGTLNRMLHLPESIDEATKVALERSTTAFSPVKTSAIFSRAW